MPVVPPIISKLVVVMLPGTTKRAELWPVTALPFVGSIAMAEGAVVQ